VALIGGALLMPSADDSYARPREVRGTITTVNRDGTSFVFSPGSGPAASYPVSGALGWQDADGTVRKTGRPHCVQPGARKPRRAAISIVDVGDADSSVPVVVRVHCLD